jgi:voltage-gated hydrogen channel 1
VLLLVALDLLGIFADIIINLYQCDAESSSPQWSDARQFLGLAGLVFSSVFMAELLLSIWAFGWRYFHSWFHSFDAAVIVAGFVTDVMLHGVLEEVASLVVVLRLWRFFKIIEEIGVGAEEQMEALNVKIEDLVRENEGLKREVKKRNGTLDEESGL